MIKPWIFSTILCLFVINKALAQSSKFLLFGPSLGTNKSWPTYDWALPTAFHTNSGRGFEGGLNVFYKSKGKFGLLGDISFLQTKSSITVYDFLEQTEAKETSKWLTAGTNMIFFPWPKTKKLFFFGAGIKIAYLHSSNARLKITYPNTNEEYHLKTDLDDLRTNQNLFCELVSGITIHRFDKHRIVLLATYSKMLGQLAEETPPRFPPQYLVTDYSINCLTLKLMVAM